MRYLETVKGGCLVSDSVYLCYGLGIKFGTSPDVRRRCTNARLLHSFKPQNRGFARTVATAPDGMQHRRASVTTGPEIVSSILPYG